MRKSNRCWLPPYGDPSAFLPKVQETRVLFGRRPYLFPDFVGRALGFLAGEQAILGIQLQQLQSRVGALAISRRHDDQLDKSFHIPTRLYKINAQPIHQLGMRRSRTLKTKILGSVDQSGTEEYLPHAIHCHARGEWMLRIN